MIVIYEEHDKLDPSVEPAPDHLNSILNIKEDLRSESYGAETVYIAIRGKYQMIKSRNAPLVFEPISITFGESLPEYEA